MPCYLKLEALLGDISRQLHLSATPMKRKAAALDVPATIVQTKPRKGSKGTGWADDDAPSDHPTMRAVILQGRPGG